MNRRNRLRCNSLDPWDYQDEPEEITEDDSQIDEYEEKMNRPMTDADQGKIDDIGSANEDRFWEGK